MFLEALQVPLRRATVEDVRQALETLPAKHASSSARQVVLRIKSLLAYLRFNAGAVIKVQEMTRSD